VDWEKKAFRGIVKFVDMKCTTKRNKNEGHAIQVTT
jgi:hypothetical protein